MLWAAERKGDMRTQSHCICICIYITMCNEYLIYYAHVPICLSVCLSYLTLSLYIYLYLYIYLSISLSIHLCSLSKRQRGIWLLQVKSTMKEDIAHYLIFPSISFYTELCISKGTVILLIRIFYNRSPSDVK